MTTNRVFAFFDNAGSPSSGQQFGSFPLGFVNKIYRVNVVGAVSTVIGTAVTGDVQEDPILFGIQYGASGYTPLNLPADSENLQFLALENLEAAGIGITWAPNTATAASGAGGGFRLSWSGQKFIGFNADTYVTFGHTFTSAISWLAMGTIEVLYD
jgi:hypothetical protein